MTEPDPKFIQFTFLDLQKMKRSKKFTKFLLRISEETLDSIDKEVLDREGMTKTGWILEAIQEKLKKDRKNE